MSTLVYRTLASRLEGLTKLYGAKILISKDVFLMLQPSFQEISRCVDIVKVKGRTESITVYEVLGLTLSATDMVICSAKEGFDDAVALYRDRRFKECLEAFERISARYPLDQTVGLYIGRCKLLLENGVPDDWDGVTKLDSK